jgi:hypothetical protein
MKALLLSFFLLLCLDGFGQFAVIADKDGYCNVRSSAVSGNNIIDKLDNEQVVYCFEDDTGWININYTKSNKDKGGYIYKGRVKYITDYPVIPTIKEKDTEHIYEGHGYKITVATMPFDKTKNKLQYSEPGSTVVVKINGKSFWGTDGGMPTTQYKSIVIEHGGKTVAIPKKDLDGLFDPNIRETSINYDTKNKMLYIQSMNGDGAGGYFVIWKIEDGVYKGRAVVYAM